MFIVAFILGLFLCATGALFFTRPEMAVAIFGVDGSHMADLPLAGAVGAANGTRPCHIRVRFVAAGAATWPCAHHWLARAGGGRLYRGRRAVDGGGLAALGDGACLFFARFVFDA